MKYIKRTELFDTLTFATEQVSLNSIPEALHEDLFSFMYGQTVIKTDGIIVFYPQDYNAWIEKLQSKGVDYDIKVE